MKSILGVGACIVLALVLWNGLEWHRQYLLAAAADIPTETITMTQVELDAMVDHSVAAAMLKEQRTLHEEVLQSKHWHTAELDGLCYTIYTGPGDIASVQIAFPKPKEEDEANED